MELVVAVYVVAACLVGWLFLRRWRRRQRRRDSLRQDNSGVYVWTDFDGSERRSTIHPEDPQGAWGEAGDAGDGGDGGGD